MSKVQTTDEKLFNNLFVLEMANNHWGDMKRGLKIIQSYGSVVRQNNVKAAIKLQFRNVDTFIHKDFKGSTERYIAKTEQTKLSRSQYAELISAIRDVGCIPMATAFDEASVELCDNLDLPIIKIASSDINDWPLLEMVASVKRPTIISSGGASDKALDDSVKFFTKRNIPLAINHCVSLYPSEDHELELNQIEYLRNRYPDHVIGLSSHEYHNWHASMYISYAKGARTWERHVDIEDGGISVSPYCSLPHQVDEWFKSFNLAKKMSGGSSEDKRVISEKETRYLDALVRGVYARRKIEAGYKFSNDTFSADFYLAVPLQKGQISTREIINGLTLTKDVQKDQAINIDDISGPYSENEILKNMILDRGY